MSRTSADVIHSAPAVRRNVSNPFGKDYSPAEMHTAGDFRGCGAEGQKSDGEQAAWSATISAGVALSLGWSIIPTGLDKKPLVPTWKPYQTRKATDAEVRSWIGLHPAGWAIVTGEISGLIALDFDGEAGRRTLERLGLPPHRRTPSGGYHVDFRHPGWHVPTLNNKSKRELGTRWPGMDIRADGGYVLFAGRTDQGEYQWLRAADAFELDILPTELRQFLGLLNPPTLEPQEVSGGIRASTVAAARRVEAERLLRMALDRVGNEGRNNAGFWLAVQLRDNSYTESETERIMRDFVARVPETNTKGQREAYSAGEAQASIRQAFRVPAREPWRHKGLTGQSIFNQQPPPPVAGPPKSVGDSNCGHDDAEGASPNTKAILAKVIATFERWLYLPDVTPLLAVFGAAAANVMLRDPVWLLLIGPPGGGKTELLNSLSELPKVFMTSTLTEASLLSATPAREKAKSASGGLLKKVGDSGILLCKDFTSVLSMHRESRASVLAALREVYDGCWTRHVGVDGGDTLQWKGKLGLIGACTSAIDTHHTVMASMGERFIMYRMPPIDDEELAARALDHQTSGRNMREELSRAVTDLFKAIDVNDHQVIDGTGRDRLIALATLAVRCRSAVERDSHSREVQLVPEPEAPGRLTIVLAQLFSGVTAVGASNEQAWRVVEKVALDSIPALRLRIVSVLARAMGPPILLDAIADAVQHPPQTTRRAIEDLVLHRVVRCVDKRKGQAGSWSLSEWTQRKITDAQISFPEMSGYKNGATFPEMSGNR